jgi:hypothetical protein
VPDFDTARDSQGTLAAGYGITFHDIAQVDSFRQRQVADEIDAGTVPVCFVCAPASAICSGFETPGIFSALMLFRV